MESLYNSSSLCTVAILFPEPPRTAQETGVSELSPYSRVSRQRQCYHSQPRILKISVRWSQTIQVRWFPSQRCPLSSWGYCCTVGVTVPSSLPRTLPKPRIRRNRSGQGGSGLSTSAADAAIAGLVVTGEGELILPASRGLTEGT